MKIMNEKFAREIVDKGLLKWRGTISSFESVIKDNRERMSKVKNKTKRDELLNKIFKSQKLIFHRYVSAPYSVDYVLFKKEDELYTNSVNEKSPSKEEQNIFNRHIHNLNRNRINAFVVLDDRYSGTNRLVILIFNPHTRERDKKSLIDYYSVAYITRHCPERIILRLKVASIEEAIDEILTSILQLELSYRELEVRRNTGSINIKRHIPTKNGALLLKLEAQTIGYGKSVLNGDLITWIHKDQFFKGQEVNIRDFNFVQIINYLINDPEPEKIIESWEKGCDGMGKTDTSRFYFLVNQFEYEFNYFVAAFKERKYLDFLVDFERYR